MFSYDLPKELRDLQALDMNKLGSAQDLILGVNKAFNKNNKEANQLNQNNDESNYLKRAMLFYQDNDIENTINYCNKTLDLNAGRIKEYISRMILYPRKENKPEKKPIVPEATADKIKSAEANVQNTLKGVIELPQKEVGYSFAPITDDMKKKNVYQIQRKEIKESKGFYKRLEKIKAKK